MFKSSRIKIAALGALVFGVAMSVGATPDFPVPPPLEENGPCWSCHTACDEARTACVANGTGYCIPTYRACVANCAYTIPGCQIP